MDVTKRSTSALMRLLFGNDLEQITDNYNSRILGLAGRNPFLKEAFAGCVNRTGFLFPYMSVEYAYYSVTRRFLPEELKEPVTGFGLIGLAVSVDDDVADELMQDHAGMVSHMSASELIQNHAYDTIFRSPSEQAGVVMDEITRTLHYVAKYQVMDASNMTAFRERGFDIAQYLEATRKTVCPIRHGLRLGSVLSGGRGFLPYAEAIGERLGVVLQLIDDLIDLRDDVRNYDEAVTLPMFLLKEGRPFSGIFEIIDKHISGAEELASRFPFPERLLSMAAGFRKASELARKRLDKDLPLLLSAA